MPICPSALVSCLLATLLQAPPTPPRAAPRPPVAAESADITQVVAEGVGPDRSKAIEDACRNAVLQAVPSVLSSETTVVNDALVKDEVSRRSGGIVNKYEVLKEERVGGDWRVKIRAFVSRKAIEAAVTEVTEGGARIDGKSIVAKKRSTRQAAADVTAELLEGTKSLLEAPFAVGTSAAGAMNAAVMKLPNEPERPDTLRLPIVVSVDVKRWNRNAAALVERLKALAPPIEDVRVPFTPWSVENPKDRAAVEEAGRMLERAPGNLGVLADADPWAVRWLMRFVREANDPTLKLRIPEAGPDSLLGHFFLAGYSRGRPGSALDAIDGASGAPTVLTVMSDVRGQDARLTSFRLGEGPLAALAGRGIPASRIEFLMRDEAGQPIGTVSYAIEIPRGRDGELLLSEGSRAFRDGGREGVLVLIPGRCNFGGQPAAGADIRLPGAPPPSTEVDTSWFAMVALPLSEADQERLGETVMRCVPR